MIIISDTSPICYLILIEQIDVLPQLFQQILIPTAVRDELLNEGADNVIRTWISNSPNWLTVQPVPQLLDDLPTNLGNGEREAISLAVTIQADLIVLDDLDARVAAQKCNLTITGTLGILYRAGIAKLIDFPNTIQMLQETSFHISQTLVNQLIEEYNRVEE